MSLLSDRIQEALARAGITQAELARRVGVTRATVGDWVNARTREMSGENLLKAARALDVTPEWLSTGQTAIAKTSHDTVNMVCEDSNIYAGPDTRGLVPLISWISAGTWDQAEDHYHPGEAEQLLPCPASHGLHTYALRVTGDSMTAPYGRSYPDGIIIYVDPDQRGGVVSGDRIIAKINGDDKVTFKVYVEDGGKRFLKPLNPAYPIITDEFRILGKIIGAYMEE